MGLRRGWMRAVVVAVLSVAAGGVGGCGDDGSPPPASSDPDRDAEPGADRGGESRVELARSDGEGGRYTAYVRTHDDGKSLCLEVGQPRRGIGGGCNPVPDQGLFVGDEPSGGLVFGCLTGHPEVESVRVSGGGRDVELPLREQSVRPPPVHRFSGEQIPIRCFGAHDRVAFNDHTIVALDGDGNPVEVAITGG